MTSLIEDHTNNYANNDSLCRIYKDWIYKDCRLNSCDTVCEGTWFNYLIEVHRLFV